MTFNLTVFKEIEELVKEKNYYEKEEKVLTKHKKETQDNIANALKATKFFSLVGLEIQNELTECFEKIGTMGLRTVFDRNYVLKLKQDIKRKQPETTILVTKDGKYYDQPLKDGGHGCVDTLGLILRVIIHTIDSKQIRKFFVIDEPGRNVSIGFKEQFSQLVKQLSTDFGVQFIIITHDKTLAEKADKKFLVFNENGTSEIQEG